MFEDRAHRRLVSTSPSQPGNPSLVQVPHIESECLFRYSTLGLGQLPKLDSLAFWVDKLAGMPGKGKALLLWSAFKRIETHIVARTLSGFLTLIPLIVTIVIILVIVGRTDDAVEPFVEGGPLDFPGFGLLALIAICYGIGLAVSTMPGRKIMEGKSVVLNHIPIVRTIYGVSEKAIRALTSQQHFSRVVFIEWPREGSVAIGFVTGSLNAPDRDEPIVIVYIPTVPNPTSGNIAFVPEGEILETDLTVEDAMKLVFSGGIVLPEEIALIGSGLKNRDGSKFVGRFTGSSSG